MRHVVFTLEWHSGGVCASGQNIVPRNSIFRGVNREQICLKKILWDGCTRTSKGNKNSGSNLLQCSTEGVWFELSTGLRNREMGIIDTTLYFSLHPTINNSLLLE